MEGAATALRNSRPTARAPKTPRCSSRSAATGRCLRAARVATEIGAPLLGINTGRLGFLTELDDGDPRIAQLPQLVDQGLLIEERAALEAEYGERTFFALNDVVVRKGDVSRIVPFGLSLDDGAHRRHSRRRHLHRDADRFDRLFLLRRRIDHLAARRCVRHRAAACRTRCSRVR